MAGYRSQTQKTMNPGVAYALGAYTLWGLFPLYFKLLQQVPALQILAHRMVWSLLLVFLILLVLKRWAWMRLLREQPLVLARFAGSALLLACNWGTYIWAVNHNHVVEASLGYYINPLINVLLGLLILGERLRRLQWLAVALAALGVLQQLWQVGSLPWVSLVLALTFGFYGLIRKQAPVAALPGLVVETWLLVPVALAWLALHPAAMSSQASFWTSSEALWLAAAGPITLVPLVCFNAAARHLPYTTLGFLQYLAPTLVLLQAILLFDEHFSPSTLLAFACIWAGLFVYSLDIWLNLRKRRSA